MRKTVDNNKQKRVAKLLNLNTKYISFDKVIKTIKGMDKTEFNKKFILMQANSENTIMKLYARSEENCGFSRILTGMFEGKVQEIEVAMTCLTINGINKSVEWDI